MNGPAILPDPRRPGHRLALATCWCARRFTLTAEEIDRLRAAERNPDPCPNVFGHAGAAAAAIGRAARAGVAGFTTYGVAVLWLVLGVVIVLTPAAPPRPVPPPCTSTLTGAPCTP